MWKIVLIVLVGAILIVGFNVFQDVDVTPGEVNAQAALDVIEEVQNSVKDTASDIADSVGRDSVFEHDTPEGLASKLWQWAKALMQLLGAAGIVAIPLNDFNTLGRLSPNAQTSYCRQRKSQARKVWLCAECEDQLPVKGFVWKARFDNFVMRFRFQDCVPGLYCDYCVDAEKY